MKVTLESTTKIVDINNGVKARLWEGRTESGIEVHAFRYSHRRRQRR
jgi:hypothetical protein